MKMKFDQAFFTWGENQLSKYKRGLGVAATSNDSKEFLDGCLSIGSRFQAERDSAKTAKFILYSEEFQTFIGVSVSPCGDGGDGRINRLCHIFVPVDKKDEYAPEEYLLDYPFEREINSSQILEQVEIETNDYDYQKILEKYKFNEKKIAALLMKVLPVVFEEKRLLEIVAEGDSEVTARELIWLLSTLMPGHARKLSYGVDSTDNKDAVRILFTKDETFGENRFHLNEEMEEEIPTVYIEMAKKALESAEGYKKFITQLFVCGKVGEGKKGNLPLLYYAWKLKEQQPVSAKELKNEFELLLATSTRSKWHRNLMMNYLEQAEDLSLEEVVHIWVRFVMPEVKRYEEMDKEERKKVEQIAKKLICNMYEVGSKNYEKFLGDLPKEARSGVLKSMFAEGKGEFGKPFDDVSVLLNSVLKRWEGKELKEFGVRQLCKLLKDEPPRGEAPYMELLEAMGAIFAMDEIPYELLEELEDTVWNMAKSMEWRMLFHAMQRKQGSWCKKHSLWSFVHPEEKEEMKILHGIFKKYPDRKAYCIANEEDEVKINSLYQNLYCMWECVFENRTIKRGLIHKFDVTACIFNGKVMCESVQKMQEEALERCDVANYLRLQQMMELKKLVAIKLPKSRFKDYEALKDGYPGFVDRVRAASFENIKDQWVRRRGLEMQIYYTEYITCVHKEEEHPSEMEQRIQELVAIEQQIRGFKILIAEYEEEIARLEKLKEEKKSKKIIIVN